jgi:hypothetical protein
MTRECGRCSMCCKLLHIEELNKAPGKWCKHARPGKGCAIYAQRPQVCEAYSCQWLRDPAMGDHWFPATSRMVVNLEQGADGKPIVIVTVDPGYAGQWRKAPYYAELKERAKHATVDIQVGKRRIVLTGDQEATCA